jgi:hypothetical protein
LKSAGWGGNRSDRDPTTRFDGDRGGAGPVIDDGLLIDVGPAADPGDPVVGARFPGRWSIGDGAHGIPGHGRESVAPGAAGWWRMLRLVVVVGTAGWVIALLASLLSPTTLLDTTDDRDGGSLAVSGEQADQLDGGTGDGRGTALLEVGGLGGSTITGGEAGDGEVEGEDEKLEEPAADGVDQRANLDLLRAASVRNRNHDDSPYRDVPQTDLVLDDHYGPRSDYLAMPGGNPERSFPVLAGGQFRASCEFSHFGYDDPLVFPGQPGASHLHMFFGNTDVNAHTTHQSLIDSGSSTCNGQELNRTGYWVPAMFDGQGNVRVPERIVVYYKGEGLSRGNSEVYPPGAAMIATTNLDAAPVDQGGTGGKKLTFLCTDNFSTNTGNGAQSMPNCDGSTYGSGAGAWTVLEMNVKFPQCWNGENPADWNNFAPPGGDWYGSYCTGEFDRNLPNMEYFVNYRVDPGESTADWFLSSDVDPTSFGTAKATGGSTSHGDWWGGWHPEVNRMWIDNCVNYQTSVASGCGKGYLTDGGPNGSAPYDGPALLLRPEYEGPYKVPAEQLFAELCPTPGREYQRPEDAAYCRPA